MKVNITDQLNENNAARTGRVLITGTFRVIALECTPYMAEMRGTQRQCLRWELVAVAPESVDAKNKVKPDAPKVRINVTCYRNNLYTSSTRAKGGALEVYTPQGNFGAKLRQLFAGRTPQQVVDAVEGFFSGYPLVNVGVATFFDFVGEYPRQIQILQEVE